MGFGLVAQLAQAHPEVFNKTDSAPTSAPSGKGGGESGFGLVAQLAKEHPELFTKMKKGGKVSSASSRADGIAQRGKTKGMMR
jgi:hypothetical protein